MTKISIYDIDFKEQGPKIPFGDVSFEEVDTYSIKFKNFMLGLSPKYVVNRIDFTNYAGEGGFIEHKEIDGKLYPEPFVDAILKQRGVNDKDKELRDKLYREKREIEEKLDGYEEIYRIFRQRDLNQENINTKTKKATSKSINRKPTPQKNTKRKPTPQENDERMRQFIDKIKRGAILTVLTISGAVAITTLMFGGDIKHNQEAKTVDNLAMEYAVTMMEGTQNGTYDPKTNEFNYNIDNKENIDLGLGVTTPENYSDLKNIYAIYMADPFGFRNIVTTIQYRDPQTGTPCNYVSFDQFLLMNGFTAVVDGQIIGEEYVEGETRVPSEREFKKAMHDLLIKERNEMIENGQDGKDLYNKELKSFNNNTKGAK